jgi:hypothetical protein
VIKRHRNRSKNSKRTNLFYYNDIVCRSYMITFELIGDEVILCRFTCGIIPIVIYLSLECLKILLSYTRGIQDELPERSGT